MNDPNEDFRRPWKMKLPLTVTFALINTFKMADSYCISFDDVKAAAGRIEGIAHKTPVLTSETIIPTTGKKYFFKVEAMQKTGSFKFRGALNAVKSELEKRDGQIVSSMPVVTHSSGVSCQFNRLPLPQRV